MKAGLVILCRFASRRLPGKILREIQGRSVLCHIAERLNRGAPDCPVVVATSTDPSDDPIVEHCQRFGLQCFRGPLDDVASRFLACAIEHGWHYAVRINGDNLFADPGSLRDMLAIASSDEYDLVTNVPGRTFPYGMSVEILRVAFYRDVVAQLSGPEAREHVTSWLYEHANVGRRYVFTNQDVPEARGLQLALDTERDFTRLSAVMALMERAPASYGLAEIAHLALRKGCAEKHASETAASS